MDWTPLGIGPTKDKGAITAAYRARLPQVNPEDRPEQFKALRRAYEEALKYADQEETPPVQEGGPLGAWTRQLRQIYADLPARLDPACWQQLLSADVCQALDTRPLVQEALLDFLTEDYFLPQAVWQVLDEAFHWTERREELYERYPRDFVDYALIQGIQCPDLLPYELFSPGLDAEACDQFRRLFFSTDRSVPGALAQLAAQLEALPERHPYGQLLCLQVMLEENREETLAGIRDLADSYPGDSRLQLEWARLCLENGDHPQAEHYCLGALGCRPDSIPARELLAESLAGQQRYEDAKKVLFELLEAAGGDQKRAYLLQQKLQVWNDALMEQWSAQLQQDPQDDAARSKLAWCLLQNGRADQALALSDQFGPDYPDRYDYHNLHAGSLFDLGRHEEAIPHFEALIAILQVMTPDGTETTSQRLSALPQKLQLLGSCLFSLGRRDQAMAPLEQALALAPEDPAVLTNMGRVLFHQDRMEEAAELFQRLTLLLPGAYHGHFLLARALYRLGRDRDAFDAVNRALDLEGGDLAVYVLKMRILLQNGVWDAVRDTLNFLRQHGVTDEINTLWCEAQLLEAGDDRKEEALELYRQIARRIEAGEPMEEPAQVYFRILVLEAPGLDARDPRDRARMLALADQGLAHDPNDPACLDYKAWLLRRDQKPEEALELYRRLEAMPRHSQRARREIAATYYEDLDRWAQEALEYYQAFLAREEAPEDHFYAGTCCRYLHRFSQGEAHFLRLQALQPEDIDGYHGLSFLYDWMGRYEDSLIQADKAIALAQNWEGDQSRYYDHKVRILRRLGRPQEAMAVVDLAAERYGNTYAHQEKFDICCQFGLWEQAKDVLGQWRKTGRLRSRLAAAQVDLALRQGDLEGARRLFVQKQKTLNAGDFQQLTLQLAELDGDARTQMAIWENRLYDQENQNYPLMNMAQVQWWEGNYERARAYAAQALEELDRVIPQNRQLEALYRSRRVLMLAILGRMDQARQELAQVRALPLCENCDYGKCKDADIFEANLEEIAGNFRRAWELHKAGAEKWPDDPDFLSGMRRMERKGAGGI